MQYGGGILASVPGSIVIRLCLSQVLEIPWREVIYVEEAIKKFMALTLARQDRRAEERDALLRKCTHSEKAIAHSQFERGLMVAGMHMEAAGIAADLEAAFNDKCTK